MQVYSSLEELHSPLPAAVLTIGNFDGVHLGHQRILATVVEEARRRHGTSVAVTFDPHPAKVLSPQTAPPALMTLVQKLALLQSAGMDAAVVVPFTREFSQLSPQAFVEEVLRARLGATVICVGQNFRFGHRHAGDVALLERLAVASGFAVRVVPPVVIGGETASSSLIRGLVMKGEVARAATFLGRWFALSGEIRPGAGRGQRMDFPTLNVAAEQECLPARGVYIAEALLEGQTYPAATNIGVRPTFDGSGLTVEAHLLGFSRQLTAGRLELHFLERLREEIKFASADALRAQIAQDVQRTRQYFAQRRHPVPQQTPE